MFTFSWSPYPSDEIIHNGLNEGHQRYYKNYHYHPIKLGFALKDNSDQWQGKVSYADIKPENKIGDELKNQPVHKAEIKDYSVYLNDHCIAIAPGKKSKAVREKFCKAVVWSLMNDPICLQDKLAEISGKITIPAMPEIIPEKAFVKLPVFPAGFIPWLNLTITEEAIV